MQARVIRTVVAVCLALLPPVSAAAERDTPAVPVDTEPGLRLPAHISKDPIFATVYTIEDPVATLDGILAVVLDLVPQEDVDPSGDPLAEIDKELGVSLRDDVLAHIGPEIGLVIDLPPPDMLIGLMAGASAEGFEQALGGIVLLSRVRDEAKLDASLRTIFTGKGAVLESSDGIVTARFGPEPAPEAGSEDPATTGPAEPNLYWGMRDGTLAIGAGRAGVRSALDGPPEGGRLTDGGDFGRVFAHLAPAPRTLVYVNLPKIMAMVEESEAVQGMLSADTQSRSVYDSLTKWLDFGMGIGSTTTKIGDGTLQMAYGPDWVSSPTSFAVLMAPITVRNFLTAVDRGKQRRTLADLRTFGTAVEQWKIDSGTFPGPTEGWVPASWLEDKVEPTYIRVLPTVDGWGHDLMYLSDGQSYTIVSPGKDGVLERDWAGELEPLEPTGEFERDIVLRDGVPVQWPEVDAD